MKRMIIVLCCLLLCMAAVCAGAEGRFRFSLFESRSSLYGRYFGEVSYEDGNLAFISPDQSPKELSFSYGGESKYYYSSIEPDILVINYGREDEYALFRLWITHCTEQPALKTHTLSVKAGGKVYAFDVEDEVEEELYGDSTHAETTLVMFNEEAVGLMDLWTAAVDAGTPIVIQLEGENGSVEFTVPEAAAQACAITYGAYAEAGGLKSIGRISGTEVSISEGGSIRDRGFLLAGTEGLNGHTLYLPSAECAVSFPPEYVFEADELRMDAQDYERFGIDERTAQSGLMTVGDQYVIYSPEDSVRYSVSVMDAEGDSFDAFTPEQEQRHIAAMRRILDGSPMSIASIGFVDMPYAKLLKVKSTVRQADYSVIYAIQYEAVYRNRQVTLTAISHSGRFTSSMEAFCDAVASTIRFGSMARENDTMLSAQKFADLNDGRAAQFSIPALWYVEGREEQQLYVETELDPYGEGNGWMTYSFTDVGQLLEDQGMSRREVESAFSEGNLEELYSSFVDGAEYHELVDAGFERIGGYEYYCAEGFLQNSYAGMTFSLPVSTALYLDRETATLHMFMYMATDDESWRRYAADVRAVIESAQYNAGTWNAYGM